jgi:hypothetical protein
MPIKIPMVETRVIARRDRKGRAAMQALLCRFDVSLSRRENAEKAGKPGDAPSLARRRERINQSALRWARPCCAKPDVEICLEI